MRCNPIIGSWVQNSICFVLKSQDIPQWCWSAKAARRTAVLFVHETAWQPSQTSFTAEVEDDPKHLLTVRLSVRLGLIGVSLLPQLHSMILCPPPGWCTVHPRSLHYDYLKSHVCSRSTFAVGQHSIFGGVNVFNNACHFHHCRCRYARARYTRSISNPLPQSTHSGRRSGRPQSRDSPHGTQHDQSVAKPLAGQ